MHVHEVRALVIALARDGTPTAAIARSTGLARSTIRGWLADPEAALTPRAGTTCFACSGSTSSSPDCYAYVLGQYLGDGHLVTSARVPVLRIYACLDYPGILSELEGALASVRGVAPGKVYPKCSTRLASVQSYWKHWTCLLPQHGPGLKHRRPIVLADWQREIVAAHPWPLIRGLIHSDGCRSVNRVVAPSGKLYSYPRYLFANESRDILIIMGEALDRVGIEWRYNRPNSISVARRRSVAAMDEYVGPKL